MSKTSSIFKNVAILGVKLKKKWKSYWCKRLNVLENIWSAKQKEKGFIWSVEEKKNEGGRKIYWRTKKGRGTKVEYRTVLGSLSNTILDRFHQVGIPHPHLFIFVPKKIVELGDTPPPLYRGKPQNSIMIDQNSQKSIQIIRMHMT